MELSIRLRVNTVRKLTKRKLRKQVFSTNLPMKLINLRQFEDRKNDC